MWRERVMGFVVWAVVGLAGALAPADSLTWVAAPPVARMGKDIGVTLNYSATNSGHPKFLYAGIAPAGGRDWIGVGNTPLAIASGTTSLVFRLDVAPAEGDVRAYAYSALIAQAVTGSWEILVVTTGTPVTVVADRLRITAATNRVQNGDLCQLHCAYQIESNGYLHADLLRPGAPLGQDWFGGGDTPLAAGAGTAVVAVAVREFPPAGTNYEWKVFIGPSSNAADASATARQGPVMVVTDALAIVAAPAVVSPNETVSVTLNYTAWPTVAGKYIKVNLLRPSQNYAWFGGTNLSLSAGTGQVTVSFRVEGNGAVSADDYVFDAFIANQGDDYDRATARAAQPVALRADTLEIAVYPVEIWTPHTWYVQLNYTVWSTRVIQVNLLTPAPDYTYRAHGVVTAQVGSGTAVVPVFVPNTFPSGWHFWSAFTAPPGGNWEQHTAADASDPIWVTLDPVKIQDAPPTVRRGMTYAVTLSWEVLQDSEVHVDLIRDGFYTWHGGAWTNIPAGTGSRTFQVTVAADTPVGSDYLWSSWVGPRGGGYENRTADDTRQPVTVEY